MRVLLVHNRYRTSAPSGEDAVVRNEHRMLEERGHEVVLFDRCNDDIDDSSLAARTATAVGTIWSRRSRRELAKILREVRPDVAHVHNTFARVSPSIYGVCKSEGIPVVQTLHNFRFFCPGALFLRDGKPCEDCLDKSLVESLKHRCYRNSLGATATLAAMLALHRRMGTYGHIDRYIALTEFARSKILKGGIPADRVSVKPNFVPAPPAAGRGEGNYVVFVGRLLEGKGAHTLLKAWRELPDLRLKIVGDGALRTELESIARRDQLNVDFMGVQPRAAVLDVVGAAKFMVIPSEWYEGFPMVIAEAFACGTPVLASRIGSLQELVESGVRGATFSPADPVALAAGVRSLLSDPALSTTMRRNARDFFDSYLTEQQNYERLVSIYADVVRHPGQRVLQLKASV